MGRGGPAARSAKVDQRQPRLALAVLHWRLLLLPVVRVCVLGTAPVPPLSQLPRGRRHRTSQDVATRAAAGAVAKLAGSARAARSAQAPMAASPAEGQVGNHRRQWLRRCSRRCGFARGSMMRAIRYSRRQTQPPVASSQGLVLCILSQGLVPSARCASSARRSLHACMSCLAVACIG